MAETLHVAVRTLHVLGMVVLLGGAGTVWYVARRDDPGGGGDTASSLASGYEWAFWGALGVMVVTGVGNLGALGAPGPETRWGSILLVKLAVVAAFVLGSLVRTVAVARMDAWSDRAGVTNAPFYRRAYGATTVVLLALVVLAEVLAHG
ncbi:Copper resistance protein D [Halomicrobium zhouii]|uniref:Copper resistance protein D n=1 Tax=Halomicrobium zhouii TaxID=767519 RepID=A0A1I6L7V0_9EURY|nr:CopD family protein [Halomicrobium zhouii]SFR99320.1 Copper resistance protein D [Halomicrobium zhouii]